MIVVCIVVYLSCAKKEFGFDIKDVKSIRLCILRIQFASC